MTRPNRTIVIRGGRVIDPRNVRDEGADVLIQGGRIASVGERLDVAGADIVDARDCIVAPGFVDLHVHLREPGFEHKETIATGTAAAAAGGFTTICCMPNTRPALDSVDVLHDLAERVKRDALVRVHPIAAITVGRRGETAVDFDALAEAGAIGFSDDGDTTQDSAIMRQALEATTRLNRPVMVHCEDKALANGSMHEGDVSRRLGIAGIPAEAEEIIIARDLLLANLTGGWLHVCHVSTGRGAEFVRQAKAAGVRVTAEVMPHHLTMSHQWVTGDRTLLNAAETPGDAGLPGDPNTKVNPPLRAEEDTRQLLRALKDGTFDVVATDHAPHAPAEKHETSFQGAAFGLSGLEFALPLMLGLVRAGHLTHSDLVNRMSTVPAHLLRTLGGTLSPGSPADVVVFDPDETWVASPASLKTKSANSPLVGMELKGRVRLTLVAGEERFRA
jgi:dihydroorotase